MIQTSERIKWIDAAKFMAIIAVLINHTNDILYTNHYVDYFSYYSVGLFIVIMGITTMWSYAKDSDAVLKKMQKSCLRILRPYIVATIIYGVAIYKMFDFEVLLNHIVRFNMSAPFYYVLLYIQMLLVSPVIFYILENTRGKRLGLVYEILGLIVVLWVACWTTNCSNILGVYGGGGKLFGGTYLILLYIGMWFGKYYYKININAISAGVFSVLICVLTIGWWIFIANNEFQIDSKLPYGGGFNPPSISSGVYALLVAATIYFVQMLIFHYPNRILERAMDVMAFLGKHSLYIFLYHRLFIDVIFPNISITTGIIIENVWIRRIVFFGGMIGGSILLEYILENIYKKILIIYRTK